MQDKKENPFKNIGYSVEDLRKGMKELAKILPKIGKKIVVKEK